MRETIKKIVKQAESIIRRHKTKVKDKEYEHFSVSIPSSVAGDTTFPFKPNQKVMVKIDGARLVIEKPE